MATIKSTLINKFEISNLIYSKHKSVLNPQLNHTPLKYTCPIKISNQTHIKFEHVHHLTLCFRGGFKSSTNKIMSRYSFCIRISNKTHFGTFNPSRLLKSYIYIAIYIYTALK